MPYESTREGSLLDTKVLFASTPALNIAYEQTGPDNEDEAILLLHGFPYDVRSYDGVRWGAGADRSSCRCSLSSRLRINAVSLG